MKFFYFFMFFFFLISCVENPEKKDTETNTFYAKYLYIYEHYDSLGLDKSIALTDEYIAEFPNAQKGYFLKAWFLAKNKEFKAVENTLLTAQKFDDKNPELYYYWSSLLLLDTLYTSRADSINTIGLRLDATNTQLLNIKTWLFLHKNQVDSAQNLATLVLQNDTTNHYDYIRTAAFTYANSTTEKPENLKLNPEDEIYFGQLKNNEITIHKLYNLLSK